MIKRIGNDVSVVDFKIEHLEQIEMREHEKELSYMDYSTLKEMSVEAKTVIKDGDIICCYGILENNGLWQIPSIKIQENAGRYARETRNILRDMIKGKAGVHSYCLKDCLHDRWMRFLGFKTDYEDVYTFYGNSSRWLRPWCAQRCGLSASRARRRRI